MIGEDKATMFIEADEDHKVEGDDFKETITVISYYPKVDNEIDNFEGAIVV